MTRRMRALPALLALATAACSGGNDDRRGVGMFPLAPSAISQATNCAGVRTVAPPSVIGGTIEAGTMTTITQAGIYGLAPAGVPLRVALAGTGDYAVTTWVTNGFGATSTTFSARGVSDGSAVRQWTLEAPGSLQLTPAPGGNFTVVVCAA